MATTDRLAELEAMHRAGVLGDYCTLLLLRVVRESRLRQTRELMAA